MNIQERTFQSETYRFGFQGQELDSETGWNSFQLRMNDPETARWLSIDPYNQFASPYVSMGNNPINGIDPDGGWFFGMFGSTHKQRISAKAYKRVYGGEIQNWWASDIHVKNYEIVYDNLSSSSSRLDVSFQYFERDGELSSSPTPDNGWLKQGIRPAFNLTSAWFHQVSLVPKSYSGSYDEIKNSTFPIIKQDGSFANVTNNQYNKENARHDIVGAIQQGTDAVLTVGTGGGAVAIGKFGIPKLFAWKNLPTGLFNGAVDYTAQLTVNGGDWTKVDNYDAMQKVAQLHPAADMLLGTAIDLKFDRGFKFIWDKSTQAVMGDLFFKSLSTVGGGHMKGAAAKSSSVNADLQLKRNLWINSWYTKNLNSEFKNLDFNDDE